MGNWGCNPILIGVITPFIIGRGPPSALEFSPPFRTWNKHSALAPPLEHQLCGRPAVEKDLKKTSAKLLEMVVSVG